MIQSLKIRNFQNHEESEVHLSSGLNVIYGDNDQGKSAILRSLNWLINNKPSGFGFQTKNKPESTTSVSVTVDEQTIIRKRNKKDNCYIIGKNKFSALRSEVPQEVKDILNLSQFAYQSQYNPHFLFTDSPGEVAKKINKIVGLEEIDVVLARVKSVKETNIRDIKYLTDKVNDLQEKVDKYSSIHSIAKKAELIQKREKIVEKKIEQSSLGNKLLEEYESILLQINAIDDLLSYKSKFSKINSVYEQVKDAQSKAEFISRRLDYLNNVVEKVQNYESLLELSSSLVEVEKAEKKLEKLTTEANKLVQVSSRLILLDELIISAEHTIEEVTKEYEKLKKRLKICPLCEKPF